MNNTPFDHILEARAIMARVKAGFGKRAAPEAADTVAEAAPLTTAALGKIAHELAPETHSEPGFGPEPDAVLEMPWAAPEIAPPWAGTDFSELEADGFSSFRRDEAAEIETEKPPLTEVELAELEPMSEPPATVPVQESEPAPVISRETLPFRHRAGRRAAFVALAAAAVIMLMITIGSELDRGFSVASNNHIAVETDDNRPLVDLAASAMSPMEEPVVVITDERGTLPAPPAPIRGIDKPDLGVDISDFLTKLAESGRNFFTSTAWAAEVVIMPAKEVETEAVADEDVPTPSADAAKSEAPDEAVSIYAVEASRNSFTVGETAKLVFTLKKDGKPTDGAGLEIHFEANPNFPNLRTVARTLDKNGVFTVTGLRPGQSGATSLRLFIGGEALEIPVTVKAAKPVPPAAKVQSAEAPVSERPAPMAIKPNQPLPAAPDVQSNEWSISPGLLRGQLESWSAQAGYQLVWKARNDFEMFSQAAFQGDFTSAVQKLFHGMHSQGSGLLRATIYQGNKVLEVTEE